ncbi:MAG: hypothetical protein U0R79_03270 [Propionicimonas sp.]
MRKTIGSLLAALLLVGCATARRARKPAAPSSGSPSPTARSTN